MRMGDGGWKRDALDSNKERFVQKKSFWFAKKLAFSAHTKLSDKEKLFKHTKTPTSHRTKANAQLQISSAITYCKLAVQQSFFVKTSVLRLHYGNPFAPIQSLFAVVLQAKPVSAEAAGNFCKLTSGRALNRPRSPEVRKPLVYFWFFSYKRKARKTFPLQGVSRFRKPRISAPQPQLRTATIKTFLRRASRFCKPRFSPPKQQLPTNKIKSFAASRQPFCYFL